MWGVRLCFISQDDIRNCLEQYQCHGVINDTFSKNDGEEHGLFLIFHNGDGGDHI